MIDAKVILKSIKYYRPIRSATNDPPSEPTAPPTKKIETINDQSNSTPDSAKTML